MSSAKVAKAFLHSIKGGNPTPLNISDQSNVDYHHYFGLNTLYQSEGCQAEAVSKARSFHPNFKHPHSSTKVYPFHGNMPNSKFA